MKIEKISQLHELQSVLTNHFGYIPENLIIESDKLIKDSLKQLNVGHTYLVSNIKILGVRVEKINKTSVKD